MGTIYINYDRSSEQDALNNQVIDLAQKISGCPPEIAESFLPEIKQIIDDADNLQTEGLTRLLIYDNLLWMIKRELDLDTKKYKPVKDLMEKNKELLLGGPIIYRDGADE